MVVTVGALEGRVLGATVGFLVVVPLVLGVVGVVGKVVVDVLTVVGVSGNAGRVVVGLVLPVPSG